jgi:putative nucleotidyltransferase with HDIG domain
MHDKGVSLLVVDDDKLIREGLALLLGGNYECTAAATAEEAMRLLAARRFDLVITDMHLPGASGLELCRLVAKICPQACIIAMSGMSDIRYEVEALRLGALYYVEKPLDPEKFLVLVESALRSQALAAAKHGDDSVARLEKANGELSQALSALAATYRSTKSALLRSLTTALEVRDLETRGHSNRVVAYSRRLGRELGLDEVEMKALEIGALLHDVGKIGVADAILLKPCALSGEEWVEMRKHPQMGAQIVERIPFLRAAVPVILQHHERWDGHGYPAGLMGEST